MAGMLRCKDDKELEALLKGSHMRVRQPGGVRFVPEEPLVRVDARGHPKRIPTESQAPASKNEEDLAEQIQLAGLPEPERQYHHLRGRAHTLDFAWPEWTVNGLQLGLEVQGMCHTVRTRFNADLEKRFLGISQSWLVLEVGGEQIKNGKAMAWLQELFQKAVKK